MPTERTRSPSSRAREQTTREGARPGAPASAADEAAGEPTGRRRAVARQARGAQRRDQVVQAAADLVLERGPGAVTHRAVARRAHASLSATTYYFTDLDELLAAAGHLLMRRWVEHGHAVLESLSAADRDEPAAVLVRAVLPPSDDAGALGHYEQLLAASRAPALAQAYARGRERLDRMIGELLERLGIELAPGLVLAVVDGGVVTAMSEGRPVRSTCERLVAELLQLRPS